MVRTLKLQRALSFRLHHWWETRVTPVREVSPTTIVMNCAEGGSSSQPEGKDADPGTPVPGKFQVLGE
ncbi:hypothetical protein GCM10022222_41950 [Amycolatopsis ultiminotia]|uniref:Uncharacterized protein n=1 Tax=Amycolatopsis ultiminotia TaxID=543629 RepID=A0ABP6WNS3_9PSEU